MDSAVYSDIEWNQINFSYVSKTSYAAIDWSNVELEGASWRKVDFGNFDTAAYTEIDWSSVDFGFVSKKSYSAINWSQVDYSEVSWSDINYKNLGKPDYIEVDWSRVNYSSWSSQTYTSVDWSKVDYSEVNWSGLEYSKFTQKDYKEVKWSNISASEYSQFTTVQFEVVAKYAAQIYGNHSRSDSLTGNSGSNVLSGTEIAGTISVNQIDTLTGGAGLDTFILGDQGSVYYKWDGDSGYALITDFTIGKDKLQLVGKETDYVLGASSDSSRSLYYDMNTNGTLETGIDDLIAKIYRLGDNANVNQLGKFV